jgi:SMC interacting uncharacterized protein involved in chromosome segregation
MKGFIAIVAFALAALLAYNYVHSGKLTLIPSSMSKGEQQLQQLEKRLDNARRQFEAAGRAAGISGVDTTADAEAARRELERIETEFHTLRSQLEDTDKAAAEAVQRKIDDFKKDLR